MISYGLRLISCQRTSCWHLLAEMQPLHAGGQLIDYELDEKGWGMNSDAQRGSLFTEGLHKTALDLAAHHSRLMDCA